MENIILYIANGVGILAVAVFALSYQRKTRRGIIICNAISRALYVLQYILLGAFAGAVLDIIGVFSSVLAQNRERPFIKRYLVPIFILINLTVVGAGILLYENVYSLLPIFGVLFNTGAFWLKDERRIRIVSFSATPFWLVYNISCRAYGSAVGDVITMVSIIFAFIRYDILKIKKPAASDEDIPTADAREDKE